MALEVRLSNSEHIERKMEDESTSSDDSVSDEPSEEGQLSPLRSAEAPRAATGPGVCFVSRRFSSMAIPPLPTPAPAPAIETHVLDVESPSAVIEREVCNKLNLLMLSCSVKVGAHQFRSHISVIRTDFFDVERISSKSFVDKSSLESMVQPTIHDFLLSHIPLGLEVRSYLP